MSIKMTHLAVFVAVEQVFDKSDEASDEAFVKLEEKLKEQAAKSRSPTQPWWTLINNKIIIFIQMSNFYCMVTGWMKI